MMTLKNGQRSNPDLLTALRSLNVFGPDQSGAYREHSKNLQDVLGDDIETKLLSSARGWATRESPGLIILTGNAGTGKTAAAQTFCEELGSPLPEFDELSEVAAGKWVLKDLSGLPNTEARTQLLEDAQEKASSGSVLVCANEGALRSALGVEAEKFNTLYSVVDEALRTGAAESGNFLAVNVNRQRMTAPGIWEQLIAYLTREELWTKSPHDDSYNVPPYNNAEALRKPEVQEGLRLLFRYASGVGVPTLRDILSLLAWMLIGDPEEISGITSESINQRNRELGPDDCYDARFSYYELLFGSGLPLEISEKSPLLTAIIDTGLGELSDLEVDAWLRDPQAAPTSILDLTGNETSRSHLSSVKTKDGVTSLFHFGETLATSEDPERVQTCIDAITDRKHSVLKMWRRRVFFEGSGALGGSVKAGNRLLALKFFPELLEIAERCSKRISLAHEIQTIVKGLNMLVTAFPFVGEGLIVPEPAGLFARDPGAFRPAGPNIVYSTIYLHELELRCPDRGMVLDVLDVDHIELELVVTSANNAVLRIGPDLYEAIRQAEKYGGPVDRGTNEMTEVRDFYSRIAMETEHTGIDRVTDLTRQTLAPIQLPMVSLIGE